MNVLQRRPEGVCAARGDAEGRRRQKGACDILAAMANCQTHKMRLSDTKEVNDFIIMPNIILSGNNNDSTRTIPQHQ